MSNIIWLGRGNKAVFPLFYRPNLYYQTIMTFFTTVQRAKKSFRQSRFGLLAASIVSMHSFSDWPTALESLKCHYFKFFFFFWSTTKTFFSVFSAFHGFQNGRARQLGQEAYGARRVPNSGKSFLENFYS